MSELFLSLLIYPALITSLRVSWYVNIIPLLVITVYHNCWLEKYFCESAINCNACWCSVVYLDPSASKYNPLSAFPFEISRSLSRCPFIYCQLCRDDYCYFCGGEITECPQTRVLRSQGYFMQTKTSPGEGV